MTGDHGPFTHSLEAWLDAEDDFLDADAVLERALEQVETKPQRRAASWPDWRSAVMNKTVAYVAAAAAVVVVGVIGFGALGGFGGNGMGGSPDPTSTPTPSPVTLASGSFTANHGDLGQAFVITATAMGDEVSGTLRVSTADGIFGRPVSYSVDLQCARTTDDGLLMIGGEVGSSTSETVANGAIVAMGFMPGDWVRTLMRIDVTATDEVPAPADSCSAFLETLLGDSGLLDSIDILGRPIEGELELGDPQP